MALKLIGSLVVLGWLLMSAVRVEDWRSNHALWSRAVSVTPTSPRPLLNLAVELRKRGEINAAVALFVRAAERSDASEHGAAIRRSVSANLTWLVAFGHPELCRRPDVQPHC